MIKTIGQFNTSFARAALSFLNTHKVALVAFGVLETLVIAGTLGLHLTGNFSHPLYGRLTFAECLVYPTIGLTVLSGLVYSVIQGRGSKEPREERKSSPEDSKPSTSKEPPALEEYSQSEFPYEIGFYPILSKESLVEQQPLNKEVVEVLRTVFNVKIKCKDLEQLFLDTFIARSGVYNDPLFYTKSAELFLWRIFARYPELNLPEMLTGLKLGTLMLSAKIANDLAVWNIDFSSWASLEQLNAMEHAILKLLDWNLGISPLSPKEKEQISKLEEARNKKLIAKSKEINDNFPKAKTFFEAWISTKVDVLDESIDAKSLKAWLSQLIADLLIETIDENISETELTHLLSILMAFQETRNLHEIWQIDATNKAWKKKFEAELKSEMEDKLYAKMGQELSKIRNEAASKIGKIYHAAIDREIASLKTQSK